MKVLHVSGAMSWGGNEQQMLDFIPELQKLGVENLVFGMSNSPLEQQCTEYGIPFIVAKKHKLNKFANYGYLKTLVKELKPDVVHLHTSDSLTVFTIADFLYGLKVKAVFSKKGMGSSSSILSKFKYNYKGLSHIICVSDAVRRSFAATILPKNHSKLVVVYDGINLTRAARKNDQHIRQKFGISPTVSLVGNIANHVAAKDLPTLVKALGHLVHTLDYKQVHLVQIGKFSDKNTPAIQQAIAESKVEEYITLADFQDNAAGFMPQFDVYVMSSVREGLPLTIYEAFLNRVPIVSTAAGGIPEVVTSGQNGYVSATGDYETLAENLKKLLEDTGTQQLFAERSYDLFYQKFTATQTAENTLKIYNQTL